MKQIYHILAVVLFVTGALLTSCNKVETTPEENPGLTSEAQTIQFTATLAAKGEDPQSKAITPGTDGEDKEILNVAWVAGEKIAVYYQKSDDSYATTTATVGTPNDDGSAPITASLTSPKDGGTVKFVYPATLHNDTGDIDEGKLLNQHGNLTGTNGISKLYDAATGSSTISTAAGTAVVSSKVTMTNRVCICKFHFSLDNGSGMGGSVQQSFNNIKIYDGNGHVYTITSDRPDNYISGTRNFTDTDDIYVAMLPVSGKTVIFLYKQTVASGYDHYNKSAANTTLTAGKFYRSLNLTLTRDNYNYVYNDYKDLSAGSITAADGDYIYQSNSATTANTITIPNGATVTLAGVKIEVPKENELSGVTCNGNANIILVGSNSVKTKADNYPAVQPGGSGTTLTISGSGSLTATGGKYGAGIGSGYNTICGDITISSGTITATGGTDVSSNYIWGAGIGCGKGGTCGNISINGGIITASGMAGSAGIGGSDNGKFASIIIDSGITSVRANCGKNNNLTAVPIGIGNSDAGSGSVTIDGTTTWTAGTATANLNFTVSTTNFDNDTWTLTPASS